MVKDVDNTENDDANKDENLPTNERTGNYFESYGAQASQRNIIGDLLRFNKGDYTYGMEDNILEEGTQVIVDMNTLSVGWQKWVDSKPVDANMGLVNEGFQPKRRKELGDLDEDEWEVDETSNKPRDPWQFTNLCIMRQLGTSGEDEGLYTFATSSRGGINAMGTLCKIYGKKVREDEDALPIIELNVDSYKHSNPQYGRIKIPVLDVVGWGTQADVTDATETTAEGPAGEAEGQGEGETQTKARTAPKSERTAPRTAAAAKKAPPKKAEPAKGGKKKTRF
jgi:hypothetical protein